jgi:hypothetical protein
MDALAWVPQIRQGYLMLAAASGSLFAVRAVGVLARALAAARHHRQHRLAA